MNTMKTIYINYKKMKMMKLLIRLPMVILVVCIIVPAYSQQTGIHINSKTSIDSVILIPEGRALLEKYFPGISTYRKEATEVNKHFTFGSIILEQELPKLQKEFSELIILKSKSLDELDLEMYNPGSSPLDIPIEKIELQKGEKSIIASSLFFSLDGDWQMTEGEEETERVNNRWKDSISSNVPGSVHTALVEAGKITDPTFGKNQMIVREEGIKPGG